MAEPRKKEDDFSLEGNFKIDTYALILYQDDSNDGRNKNTHVLFSPKREYIDLIYTRIQEIINEPLDERFKDKDEAIADLLVLAIDQFDLYKTSTEYLIGRVDIDKGYRPHAFDDYKFVKFKDVGGGDKLITTPTRIIKYST